MEAHIRTGMWRRHEYWWTRKPSGLCYIANLFLYIYFKPYCVKVSFEKSWGFECHYKHTISTVCFLKSTDV